MQCWEIMVYGRVQGVGFRWFVKDCARHNSITGYVRNQVDGSVRIVACGAAAEFNEFRRRIEQGNSASRIERIEVTALDACKGYDDFSIR